MVLYTRRQDEAGAYLFCPASGARQIRLIANNRHGTAGRPVEVDARWSNCWAIPVIGRFRQGAQASQEGHGKDYVNDWPSGRGLHRPARRVLES